MIDGAFAPNDVAAADVAGRAVGMIDVLRATTTICTALANGAKVVIPVADTEAASRLLHSLDRDDVILAGERHLDPIPECHAASVDLLGHLVPVFHEHRVTLSHSGGGSV